MAAERSEEAFRAIADSQFPELSTRERQSRALADAEAIATFGSGQIEVRNRQEYLGLLGVFGLRLALWPEEMAEVAHRLAIRHKEAVRNG